MGGSKIIKNQLAKTQSTEEAYKVIISDNLDRDHIPDRLYEENLIKEVAEQIAETKNKEQENKLVDTDYYRAVPMSYKLYTIKDIY